MREALGAAKGQAGAGLGGGDTVAVLLPPHGQTAAILVIGVTFGLWHGLIEALPVLIIFGIGLAYLRSRTNSIYPGMILHATFNGAALILAVTT